MSIFWGLEHYNAPESGVAVTIGTFDGLHKGHQALLDRLLKIGRERNLPTVAVTFDRHPLEILAPERAPLLLTTSRERAERIASRGVNRVLVLKFDEAFAAESAEFFIKDTLLEQIGMKAAAVGENFFFGKGRQGNAQVLKQVGQEIGFDVDIVPPVVMGDEVVSSSAIRAALESGDITKAAQMLGCCYRVRGSVVDGEHKGRELGFPTANVQTHPRIQLPSNGIYAVNVRVGNLIVRGAANLGVRPTLGIGPRWLEVHLIGYSGDVYGMELEVQFLRRIRDEIKFDSVEQLVAQIKDDISKAIRVPDCPNCPDVPEPVVISG